jgi:hypothetical protein
MNRLPQARKFSFRLVVVVTLKEAEVITATHS